MTSRREHTHGHAATRGAIGWVIPLAAALLFNAGLACALRAQIAAPTSERDTERAQRLDGRTFDGVRFAADAQIGDLVFRARRATAWEERGTPRLLLEGDVRLKIGLHDFYADRAVVWMEPFDETPAAAAEDEDTTRDTRQVAVYFENVREPVAAASVAVSGPRLLVTAVTDGGLSLRADRLDRGRSEEPLVSEGEARLARYLEDLLDPPPPPEPRPKRILARKGRPAEEVAGAADAGPPRPHQPILNEPLAEGYTDPSLGPADRSAPLRSARGVVSFFGPTREWVGGKDENAAVVSGGVAVNYTDAASGRSIQLTAERAVVFLDPGSIDTAVKAGIDSVRGVYLEGNAVATDGRYTLRAPRLYADLKRNQAVALDGVFWTYDLQRGMPLYLRADVIRQESDSQWKANGVRLANSSFFEPHLALGATSVTVTRRPVARGVAGAVSAANAGGAALDAGAGGGLKPEEFEFDAKGVSLRAGGTPILPLPDYKGGLFDPMLREVTIGAQDGKPVIKTTWDFVRLLGLEQVEGLQSDLLLDGYFSKGPAVGTDTRWSDPGYGTGGIFGYYIFDNGEDDLTSGAELDHEDDSRGMALLEHRWALSRRWALFLEGAWVSDPAFVDAFFPGMAETRREVTNSAMIRYADETSVFSLEARGSFNDFTPNEYLLQSQGYQVTRLPEFRYSRPNDSFFDGKALISSDTRLSRVAFNFNEPRLNEFGFDTIERAGAGFGLLPTDSLADRLRLSGLTEENVLRADSRHEISVPLKFGGVSVTPFGVGRFTAYDDDFDAFAGSDEDQFRLFGSAGTRVATSFQHINDEVESRFFDIHGLRHVIEPSATGWYGFSTRDGALPIYDDDVENISEGIGARAGVVNTWQTKRGNRGEREVIGDQGDWHTVDWLTIRTDYVWFDGSVDRKSPIGRWDERAPELSNPGEFIDNEATLQLTDAVAFSSRTVFDMEQSGLAYQAAGMLVDHGENFSTFAEFRYIDARDTTLMDFGARYALSRKYAVLGQAAYDLDNGDIQSFVVRLERRFPQVSFEVALGHDNITDDTFVSFALRPQGIGEDTRRRLLAPVAEYDRSGVRSLPGDRGPRWPLRSNQNLYGP